MKNPFYLMLVALLVFAACKSTQKMAYSPLGSWNYTVSDTPNGDISGLMVLAKEGDKYVGSLQSDAGSLELNNIKLEDNKLSCTFYYDGYELELTGTFMGETFEGTVGLDYNTFPVKATRGTAK